MKIAYICADRNVPVFGCKSRSLHVQEMLAAIARQHNLTLFARNLGGETPYALHAVDVHRLSNLSARDPQELEQLAIKSNLALAGRIKDLGLFDLVYERYSPWSYGGLEAARQTAAITVLEVNEDLIGEYKRCSNLHDEVAALNASKRAFEAADVIIATSQKARDYLDGFAEAKGKVHIITRGVNYDRYRPYMPRVPGHQKPLTLGFLGSLKTQRGVGVMLESYAQIMRKIPNSRVRIIGDGPERPRLEELCRSLGIFNRVQFTGAVAPVEVPHQLGEMDIGLAPYLSDGDGCVSALKICEYMASGLPVIASAINPVNGMIEHLKTGLLVEPNQIDPIVKSVLWLHRNPGLSTRLAEQAQKKALSGHTWGANLQKVLELCGFPPQEKPRSLAL
jgi:glycosyltransferase involved in cell wall biosynthesis